MRIIEWLLLVLGLLGAPCFTQAGESAVPSPVQPAPTASADFTCIHLLGIASIGEKKFVYLVDNRTLETIQLQSGCPHPSGLELVEVVETAAGGNRARVRRNGVEGWLNFSASPSLAATIIPSAESPLPVQPPVQRAPASNPGTFSNDTPSKRRP